MNDSLTVEQMHTDLNKKGYSASTIASAITILKSAKIAQTAINVLCDEFDDLELMDEFYEESTVTEELDLAISHCMEAFLTLIGIPEDNTVEMIEKFGYSMDTVLSEDFFCRDYHYDEFSDYIKSHFEENDELEFVYKCVNKYLIWDELEESEQQDTMGCNMEIHSLYRHP